jgi:large subunit ribosomal protein L21
MSFAIIKTGGKQYRVAANDVLKIEKIAGEPGDVVTFDQVLMVGNGSEVTIGTPLVEGALVAGHFVSTDKQRTVLIVKKHRRQHFDRRNGHRQLLSTVRITEILTGGAQPTTGPDERLKARHAAKATPAAGAEEAVTAAAAALVETTAAEGADAESPVPEADAEVPARKTPVRKSATKRAAAKKTTGAAVDGTEKKSAPRKKATPKTDQE